MSEPDGWETEYLFNVAPMPECNPQWEYEFVPEGLACAKIRYRPIGTLVWCEVDSLSKPLADTKGTP